MSVSICKDELLSNKMQTLSVGDTHEGFTETTAR